MDKYKPARSVDKVIEKILTVIPESESNLILELRDYYYTLWNKAPELLKTDIFWIPLGKILENHITNMDKEWKIQTRKIFNYEYEP
jgi:hypothetical protein